MYGMSNQLNKSKQMLRRHRVPNPSLSRSIINLSSSKDHRHNSSHLTRLSKSSRSPHRATSRDPKDQYKEYRDLYNANVSQFREIFNSNDISQVPFMSTLRKYSKSSEGKRSVNSPRFQQATKSTLTHQTAKRVGDFKTNSSLLAPVYFRWHNKSGRNNLWSTDFQCSLRNYGSQYNPQELKYNNLRQPIVYNDVQIREFEPSELICARQKRSFRIKRE